ncbi:MAG: hypothetical protein DI598_02070 [Pseudopedobacter saltans]|uniref:Carboxypeptidase-like regulatory domain-containing protein n=1 Tax=Pseudopedobacter saltans TaxID=151895 RepID=A0A2W5FE08_9SPHI|nr:MAG: hypothetical protein DI598_02070 [Pseudopedobacter saltans]
MKIALAIVLYFLCSYVHAQTITGIVKDTENGKPLIGVTVYIGNSSRSTVSDGNGTFSIVGFSNSPYELIFSFVGYEILVIPSQKIGKEPLNITLKPKENSLDPVAVQTFEKDGWKKWGKLFMDNFIGTLPFSNQCTIKNKDVIKFRYSEKKNELEAIAFEPLIIVNDYLGYKIRYDLEYFINNFKSHYVFYAGYPVFSNISNSSHYLKIREKRRAEVYTGSLLHFARAMYNNTIKEDGFQIRKLQKIPNLEKKRVDSIYKNNNYVSIRPDGTKLIMNKVGQLFPRDTVNYFKAVQRQPDILNILSNKFLSANDLFVRKDTSAKVFEIPDYLYITFPSKLELPEYYTNKFNINGDSCITAVISFLDDKKLSFYSNGAYFPPTNLLTEQYWSWSDKISSMLPFDYKKLKDEK